MLEKPNFGKYHLLMETANKVCLKVEINKFQETVDPLEVGTEIAIKKGLKI